MRRWKKVLYAGIAIGIILIGVRIGIVNHNLDLPKVQVYEKGQTVEYGDDFTSDATECINGYSVTIKDAKLMTTKEYYENYLHQKFSEEIDSMTKYYYVIKAEFHNKDSEPDTTRGVSLEQTPLLGVNYMMVIDYSTFTELNPKLEGLGFSLRKNSSFEVLLPYAVIPHSHADYKTLIKDPPKLQITEYPHRKLLKIQ